MADDYYKVLEVSRSASTDEIQKAYRKLARKYHPDLHADKDEKEKNRAKQNFQKVQQAYDVLSDSEKRQKYDQFGEGFEQMGGGGNPFGRGGAGGGAGGPGGMGDFDFSQIFGGAGRGRGGGGGGGFEDILRQMGSGGAGARRGAPPQPQATEIGKDFEQEITIPFAVAVLGGKHQVRLARNSGKVDSIDVTIPIGIEQLQKIRLRGQGHPGAGGSRGDLIIKVKIAAHPNYSRSGLNLSVSVPITLIEAAEGAKIELPTPHGRVSLSVPAGSSSGKSLRLKGMGIRGKKRSGDLIATLQLVVPDEVQPEDVETIKSLSEPWNNPMRDELTW